MQKQEIISLIRNYTLREDATQRFHEAVLAYSIEKVLIEMYNDLYRVNPRLVDNFTKQYGVTTPIAVNTESTTGLYYSTIPVEIVPLATSGSGVRHIYPIGHTGNVFIPMDATEADHIFNTDVAIVTNKIGYRTRQDTRVDYYNMNGTILASGVRMDLLVPFSVYADTDNVMIPELTEREGGGFIPRVLQVLRVIPPADLSDSNAPAREQANNK